MAMLSLQMTARLEDLCLDTRRVQVGGMPRALVTGADGFIGSHLVELLVRSGLEVRAMAQYNSMGTAGWLEDCSEDVRGAIEVLLGDVRDPFGVNDAVKGCDVVLHLAALIAIPYSYRSPASYVQTNVLGTLNVVQAVRDHDVERLIHTSTSEVYGTARFVPIHEDHPLHGQSPYSASKIGADQIAMSFHRSFGTPVTTIRPFNTYGPRQSTRAVIPTIIAQIVAGRRSVALGAVKPTRDFTFVTDTAHGFLKALGSPEAIGETINLGCGFEISIEETAREIAQIMGVEIELVSEEERQRPTDSEVERLWSDNSKAQEMLGWSPEFGGREGFREGLRDTVDWFCNPINLARYRPFEYSV